MLAADVYDVAPTASAVGTLFENGIDPWVVDFGSPEHEEGGLDRTLTDHVLAVSDAVDRVREFTGRDVNLGGYSQGGMFCYQTAAYRRGDGLDSVIAFGSPVDLGAAIPFGLPEVFATRGAGAIADLVGGQALPAWASRLGFRMMDPVKALRQQVEFVLQLHNREALLPRERQRRFLQGDGWVAWPGPAMAEMLRQFVAHNRMLSGGFVITDHLVTLADIAVPVLTFVGEVDEIAPPKGVRAIRRAAPQADVYEITLRAGHFGLVVGSMARDVTRRGRVGALACRRRPAARQRLPGRRDPGGGGRRRRAREHRRAGRVRHRVGGGGRREPRAGVAAGMGRTVRSVRELTREAASQLPRLARLEQIQPSTRISLGLLLEEQAKRAPEDVLFLFEGRAHTQAAAKHRIDSVVRGLISVGVRQGDHVGVLMGTRPTALALLAALSRLGAVAVLLRPESDVRHEAELGMVTRIISDPENAATAAGITEHHDTLLLGGGRAARPGPPADRHRAHRPGRGRLPASYHPNPGKANDLAFILFTGEGSTRA